MSMWPIIYRMFYPFLAAAVAFCLWAFFIYKSYKSSKRKMKKHKEDKKRKKAEIIILLSVALLSISVGGYYSLDLILQDFVTQTGIYDTLYYDHDLRKICFDVNGESESVLALGSYTKGLIEGYEYKFTYAKRSGMLLAIDRVDN